MKLSQLRYVLEVHRQKNHISGAADALHTSQPGVSRQIRQLEHELGFQIFERKRNRVIGLTEPGQEVYRVASRVVADMETLSNIKDDYATTQTGVLTLATTHTHARYILPPIIAKFMERYPKVQINLQQGNPTDICVEVQEGRADLAIGTEAMRHFDNLLRFPCFQIRRVLVAPKDHPILALEQVGLDDIARYPIIAHDQQRSGRWRVFEAFERKGLSPRIIFGSVDADISKTYVELGLGIAILAKCAFDADRDTALGARDVGHLFDPSTSFVSIRAHAYLRRFVYDFIRLVSPELDPNTIRRALKKAAGDA